MNSGGQIKFIPDAEIRVCALRSRALLGVNEQWNFSLVPIIENRLPEFIADYELHIDDPEQMNGADAYVANYPPRIVVAEPVYDSGWKNEPRARFTLAHELAHLLLHLECLDVPDAAAARLSPQHKKLSLPSRYEVQANLFAAEFLLPEHIVRLFSDPRELSQCCGVSHEAAERGMRRLGLWPKRSEYVTNGFQELLAYLRGHDKDQK
jgi:hypothetical protein